VALKSLTFHVSHASRGSMDHARGASVRVLTIIKNVHPWTFAFTEAIRKIRRSEALIVSPVVGLGLGLGFSRPAEGGRMTVR